VRRHLEDAHQRVMSIAALQRHLAWLASMTWRSDPISSNFAKASPHQ
jgi:hypothetical protein